MSSAVKRFINISPDNAIFPNLAYYNKPAHGLSREPKKVYKSAIVSIGSRAKSRKTAPRAPNPLCAYHHKALRTGQHVHRAVDAGERRADLLARGGAQPNLIRDHAGAQQQNAVAIRERKIRVVQRN